MQRANTGTVSQIFAGQSLHKRVQMLHEAHLRSRGVGPFSSSSQSPPSPPARPITPPPVYSPTQTPPPVYRSPAGRGTSAQRNLNPPELTRALAQAQRPEGAPPPYVAPPTFDAGDPVPTYTSRPATPPRAEYASPQDAPKVNDTVVIFIPGEKGKKEAHSFLISGIKGDIFTLSPLHTKKLECWTLNVQTGEVTRTGTTPIKVDTCKDVRITPQEKAYAQPQKQFISSAEVSKLAKAFKSLFGSTEKARLAIQKIMQVRYCEIEAQPNNTINIVLEVLSTLRSYKDHYGPRINFRNLDLDSLTHLGCRKVDTQKQFDSLVPPISTLQTVASWFGFKSRTPTVVTAPSTKGFVAPAERQGDDWKMY